MSNTVQQLRDARALVKAGWIKGQHSAHSSIGHRLMVCTQGALNFAGAKPVARTLVGNHLAEILGVSTDFGIPRMNDRFWTRKSQVLKAFDRAIVEAEQIEQANLDAELRRPAFRNRPRRRRELTKYPEMASL